MFPYISLIILCLFSSAVVASQHKITIDIEDYKFLKGKAKVQYTPNTNKKYIGAMGEVGYEFNVVEAGWYAIFVEAAPWPVNIFLDGELLTHTTLVDYQAPLKNGLKKLLSVYVDKGAHTIAFDHSWAPGLPLIKKVIIESTDRPASRASVEMVKDRAVYRQFETVPLKFLIAKYRFPYKTNIIVSDAVSGALVNKYEVSTESGEGNQVIDFSLPSSKSGVFNVDFIDNLKVKVLKSFQYVVVGENNITSMATEEKVLVHTIDVAKTEPDYFSTKTRVVNSAAGLYRESGDIGYYNNKKTPDYFSYRLDAPQKDQLYMVEISIPDDKKRTFTASVIDSAPNPYALDSGVMTGREYPLSMSAQKLQVYFYSKGLPQRLLFLNWHSGEKIAVKKINLFKINKLSQTITPIANQRRNAMYFEEPMRFTTYFGADTSVKDWVNIEKAATRWARWSRSNYVNHWVLAIAAYQGRMWPTKLLPGLAPGDSWSGGMLGEFSNKDIVEKDILWLLLLIAEKHGIKVTFELQMKPNKTMVDYLEHQWQVGSEDNKFDHMVVSKNGELGKLGPQQPYFNPVNHNVQNWVESIFSDLAGRYHTLPAFDGVSVRLMQWAFAGWQTFPSIDWGYGDYTINQFEKDTKIVIPDVGSGKSRYAKRYTWLMDNAYGDWIEWRSKVIHQYHSRLENILISRRDDLKLYFDIFNPTYAVVKKKYKGKKSNRNRLLNIEEYDKKGWEGLLKEASFDLKKYDNNRNIVMLPAKRYPAGIRINKISPYASYRAAAMMDGALDQNVIESAQRADGAGSVSSVMFYNEYMEADFPVSDIGLDIGLGGNKKKKGHLRIVGVLNPAGSHMLARYADALVDGNVTFLADGGLGYALGQPDITKEFMQEYMSIPAIGMNRHSDTDDAVALWYGRDQSKLYFYLVNRADYPVNVVVELSKNSSVKRSVTGKSYLDNTLSLTINPYEMLSFQSDKPDTEILKVHVKYPESEKLVVQEQLFKARKIIKDFKKASHANKYLDEIQLAENALDDVQSKYDAADYYKAKKSLMSHPLVRIYTLEDKVPEGLWVD